MEAFIFVLLCILWFISGAASFIYWWTTEADLTWDQLPLVVGGGLFGPFTCYAGWLMYTSKASLLKEDGVLFKKREKSS